MRYDLSNVRLILIELHILGFFVGFEKWRIKWPSTACNGVFFSLIACVVSVHTYWARIYARMCMFKCLFNHVMSRVATRIFSTDCYPFTIEIIGNIHTHTPFGAHTHDGLWLLSNRFNGIMALSAEARVAFYRPIEKEFWLCCIQKHAH